MHQDSSGKGVIWFEEGDSETGKNGSSDEKKENEN